jgi:F-type H+-transporting ATPase subunit delta
VSATASLTSGAAGRYATALFEIAAEAKRVEPIEADLDLLAAAMNDSSDLRDLVASPIYPRDQQGAAMQAICAKMEMGTEVSSTVALMAANRRLPELSAAIAAFKALAAAERGELTADVTAASALSAEQRKALADTLAASLGKKITMNETVDPSLIGGLIVKVGSVMVDTSIKSKLSQLQNAMKEVG